MASPLSGLNAYSTPTPDGGINVDVDTMLADLITIMKAAGATKDAFLEMVSRTFDEVSVTVRIPNRAKN